MKPIAVDFDAQPLLKNEMTGIGTMACQTLCALAGREGIAGTLNLFTLRKARGYERQWQQIGDLAEKGFVIRRCGWFTESLYKLIWNFIPLPYRWFFGSKADITHFFNYYVPPGIKGLCVTTVADMVCMAYPETMNFKTRAMLGLSLKKSVRRADAIVTISEFSKREIIKYLAVPEDRITVVPCGVDLHTFHPDIPETERLRVRQAYGIHGRYFLYLGTLEPRKNLVMLIDAYAQLLQRRPDAPVLCIAGRKGWQYDEIFQTVQKHGLEKNVVFTGYVPAADAPPLMAGATAFVFPSLYEGFGLPPLEAMACGTPVITSDAASLPEVVGDAGLMVGPEDTKGLSVAMERLAGDGALRQRLIAAGLARTAAFTWEKSADALVDLYRGLLREGGQ